MDDAALGLVFTVDLAGPMPSWYEAMCLGEGGSVFFWNSVEREWNECVDLVCASRVLLRSLENGANGVGFGLGVGRKIRSQGKGS